MKHLKRPLAVLALVLICAFVSMNAQSKKQKVALIHNGHVIVVAPEAVPAHLAHGDTYANESNSYTITIVNSNPSGGTITGPTTVAAGDTGTYIITPNDGFSYFLTLDGVYASDGNLPYTYYLTDVNAPHTLTVNFF